MKCLKPLRIYALSFLLIPFLLFSLTLTKAQLEKIACKTLKDSYPSLECKGITFYGKKLTLPEGVYFFNVKKSGNSFLLEIVNAESSKVVKVIPIKVSISKNSEGKNRIRSGKRIKLIFIKGNIEIESEGTLLESGNIGQTVRVERGKKIFYGRLKDENTVVVELP